MSTTADITKAARALAVAERKLAKVVANEEAAIAKATSRASKKYAEKIAAANTVVAAAKAELQKLVADA